MTRNFDELDCKLADSKVEGVRIIEVVHSKSPFAFLGEVGSFGRCAGSVQNGEVGEPIVAKPF